MSLVSKQWLVYSKLAVIILGIGGSGFCGAVSVEDLKVSGLFLSLITPFLVCAWLELPCQIGQNQITSLAGHSKRFPCLCLTLPGVFKLNFCHGNIEVLKVVVSQENKYCALRSYTCKLSL